MRRNREMPGSGPGLPRMGRWSPPTTEFTPAELARGEALFRALQLRQGRRQDRWPAGGRTPRDRLRRPLECRQVEPDQRAHRAHAAWRAPRSRPGARASSTSSASARTARSMLVDMPGYGYARASKAAVKGWTRLIRDYLRGRREPEARVPADRCAARDQAERQGDHDAARRGGACPIRWC